MCLCTTVWNNRHFDQHVQIFFENRFNWTTPVQRLLKPSFPFQLYDEQLTTQTTLEDILSHRTGIPDYFLLLLAGYPYHITREQLVRCVLSLRSLCSKRIIQYNTIQIKIYIAPNSLIKRDRGAETTSTDIYRGHDAECRVIIKVDGTAVYLDKPP